MIAMFNLRRRLTTAESDRFHPAHERVAPAAARPRNQLRRRIRVALLAVAPLLAVGTLTPVAPANADSSNGLVLWYRLNEDSGSVATDSSGYGHDGTVNGTASWGGDQGLTFDGSDTYIKVPDNIMAGLTSITVAYDVWIDPGQSGSYLTYGFGNTSNGYLFGTGDPLRAAISPTDYTQDQNTVPADWQPLTRGTWKHVTYTQTGTTGILYEDGTEVARNTSVTTTPASIGNGTTTADYIGRSLFYSDHYFKGRIRDFRVYNRALPATEVQSVAAADWEEVQALATYNNALDAFEDPTIGPVVIFPSDYTGDMDHLQPPPDWTDSEGNTPASWPTPTIARSDLFTADQISVLQDAVYQAIQPDGDTTYSLTVRYDGMSDRVVAQTDAPSSVTGPLATQYSGQLVINTVSSLPSAPPACTPADGPTPTGDVSDPLTQLQELANYNCALAYFEDPTIGPVVIFPSDRTGDIDHLQTPTDWTDSDGNTPASWPTPTTARSVLFTAAQVKKITDAVYAQIAPDGDQTYNVYTFYDGPSDRVIVATNAPSSVTDPLVTAYPGQLTLEAFPTS